MSMTHTPDRKQRSTWKSGDLPPVIAEPDAKLWWRNVHDGQLRCIVGTIPGEGLHLSISHVYPPERKKKDGPVGRYPSWDEIVDARQHFLPADVGFVMHLPPADEYVAFHQTTFHLHEEAPPHTVRMAGKLWQVQLLAQDGEPMPAPGGGVLAALVLTQPVVETTATEVGP